MLKLRYRTAKWLLEVRIDATMLWVILQVVHLASEYLLNNILQ